ncbi:MAG: oligosaccharide flippase family protein [Verrucomicrobia bacterium]|nr:oligosaccharide flippase family protein [Verrucomicrobiota bacterium]
MSSFVPIVCNQAITVLLGVLGVKLFSAFVPKATYGHYALFLTLTQVGVMVTHSGIVNHAMRYWQRERSQAAAYTRFLWKASWRGLADLAPLLILIALAVALNEREFAWLWIVPWLVLGNIAMAITATATGALNADRKLWGVFVVSVVSNAARILIPIGLALSAGMTFFMLGTGFALHGVLVLGGLAVMFRWALAGQASSLRVDRASSPRPASGRMPPEPAGRKPAPHSQTGSQGRWEQELREYGRPFVWLGIGAWFLQCADRWVVKIFFGEEEAGLFAFASNIGAIVPTFVVGGVMQKIFPQVFRQADHAQTRREWEQIAGRCDQATGLFLLLTILGLVMLQALGPYLLGWLIAEQYAPALDVLLPAGFAMVTSQINQFYYLLLQGQHNSAGMVKVMLVVSGLKTLGSVASAAISWPAFLLWLMISTVLGGWIGRTMIRSMALRAGAEHG